MPSARRADAPLLVVGVVCVVSALVVTVLGSSRTTVHEVADGVSYVTHTGVDGPPAWLPVALAATGLVMVAAGLVRRHGTPA